MPLSCVVSAFSDNIPSILFVIDSLFLNRIVSALILEIPVTMPSSIFTVPSKTIEDPGAGLIFIDPEEVLIETVLSPWIISSANIESATPISPQERLPAPSVFNICPLVPSLSGNTIGVLPKPIASINATLSICRFLNCIFLCPISILLSNRGTIELLVKLTLF